MNLLSYKRYVVSVEFDEQERIFYGRLALIRGLVSYEARDAEGLVRAFPRGRRRLPRPLRGGRHAA
jgi:predicted HicB family RNase H-like nuclease